MILKNTLEDIIVHISVNGVPREIIIDFSRKKIILENLQMLREIGETSIEEGKSDFFEGIKCDPSLHDNIIYKCEECSLENIINRHDCTLTSILLQLFTEVDRRMINMEEIKSK